jgi:hypothetical protein
MVLSVRMAGVVGLSFVDEAPVPESEPNRADVALFVGFVARRQSDPPPSLQRWLLERGWASAPYARPPIDDLLDIPVPIDEWDLFDALFAWEQRPLDAQGQRTTSYLGAAVRSFFAQGGRRCYVVRVGDPWMLSAPRADRMNAVGALIPGYPATFASSPADRQSWRGAGHLFGLPDVSFICFPDLADAVASDRLPLSPPAPAPAVPPQFGACSSESPLPPPDTESRLFEAPRCDERGYSAWARALCLVTDIIARRQREVQLVAAVPLPTRGTEAERDLLAFLTRPSDGPLSIARNERLSGLASAFVQLAYPWVRTPGSADLPEGIESPDAVLTGILARNVLTQGAFTSAAGLPLGDVYDLYPLLRRDQMLRPQPDSTAPNAGRHGLAERVSLFALTPGGLTLFSDVTTSLDEGYRPASVNRLVSVIARAARRIGEELLFEVSGERLWAGITRRLETLLLGLLQAGALRGTTAAQAFSVTCDRSTMSQNDLDNGRVVAQIQFDATAPIEGIVVILAMSAGGQVSLTTGATGGVAA